MDNKRPTVMMAVGRTRQAWDRYNRAVALRMGVPESYTKIIMFLARRPGENQKAVAEFVGVTTAAVNQTVKEMVRAGYVEKRTDETDRRYSRLYLTARGTETAEGLRAALRRADAVITAAITPEKETEMVDLLDRIFRCIREELPL